MTTQRARRAAARQVPRPFDGYPYLVTRIGRSALRHFAIVPADWSRRRLVDLAVRQAEANQLETCLCLGPRDAVYLTPGRPPAATSFVPSGIPVADRLVVAGPIEETVEQQARRAALRAYVERIKSKGYLVGDGLEGGRPATSEDLARMAPARPGELPPGMHRCIVCGEPRGEALVPPPILGRGQTPHVAQVHCRCDNHNRCAGCGELLYALRLSAWYWDEEHGGPRYVAAYCGLGHRCRPGAAC